MGIILHGGAHGSGLDSRGLGFKAAARDCSHDDENGGARGGSQFVDEAATGVIAITTDESVDPLNCSTRSLLAGNSNSTILCGRAHSRDPEKSLDFTNC
jgi:hypothetical protein